MRFDDGLCHVQFEDDCMMCGEPLLGEGSSLVMVESGQMGPMKRDPSFLKFTPDFTNENDLTAMDEAAVNVYHTECLVARAWQGGWGRFSPIRCDFCEKQFLEELERWAFRLRIGDVDYETAIFMHDENAANVAVFCSRCFKHRVEGGGINERAFRNTG